MKRLVSVIIICVTIGYIPLFLELLGILPSNFSSDFFQQIIPLTIEAKRMLSSGSPFWSWNALLGDNFIGSNNFYVFGSPFTLLFLLTPNDFIEVWVVVCIYLQYILYGVSSMLYFRRMGFDDTLSRIGAYLYTLSSFCIIIFNYFNFSIGIILFPLFLICIENLICKRRYALVQSALLASFMLISSFYFAAISFMAGGIYLLCRIFIGQTHKPWKVFINFSIAILLGIITGSILFLPTILSVGGSSRNTINLGLEISAMISLPIHKLSYLFIPRFADYLSTLSSLVCSSHSIYLPCIGSVFALAYVVRNLKSWLSILLISCFIIILTPLNAIFSLGANQFYGRWCYFIILMLILASLYAIKEKYISRKIFITYSAVSACIVFLAFAHFAIARRNDLVSFNYYTVYTLCEIAIYLVGLLMTWWAIRKSNIIKALTVGILFIGTLDMLISNIDFRRNVIPMVKDNILHNPMPENNACIFKYRTDIVFSERNLGFMKNYAAPTTFHSVMNKNANSFYETYIDQGTVTFIPTHHRKSLDALISVKDIYRFHPTDTALFLYNQADITFGVDTIEVTEAYTLLRNRYYIPMGFAFDSYMNESEFLSQLGNTREKDSSLGLLQHLVLPDSGAVELKKILRQKHSVNFNASLDSVVNCRRQITCHKFEGTTRGFTASITNPKSSDIVIFFSVPADPGFTAYIDGDSILPIYKANLGMMAVKIPSGTHQLVFKYITPGLKTGALLSALGLLTIICLFFIERKRYRR